ncbi:MAG: 30S ribosomal protein S9 [Armatimonadota bacterium]
MAGEIYYGTGHRKDATARVWIMPGTGEITINGKPMSEFFGRRTLEGLVSEPFVITDTLGQYDVRAKTRGGGIAGQAGAVRHGIARALVMANPELRTILRRTGLLTRDPRVKERKKAGRHRARRAKQFSKR